MRVDISAVGPLMLRVAGEVADGVHVHPLHSMHYIEHRLLPGVADGAARAGRSTDDIDLIVPVFACPGDTPEERAPYVAQAKRQIAFYGSTPNYAFQFDDLGFDGTTDRIRTKMKAGELDTLGDLVTDEMLDAYALVAPWDEMADRLLERYEGTATRVVMYLGERQMRTRPAGTRTLGRDRTRRSGRHRLNRNVARRQRGGRGSRTGVVRTYSWYSGSSPHRFAPRRSSIGIPLIRVRSTITNTGEISVTQRQPDSTGTAMIAIPTQSGDLAEVVRVSRPGPQAGGDEPAVVGRVLLEGRLLSVGDDLDGEPDDPHDRPDDRDHTELPRSRPGHDRERTGDRQQHPEALQRPGHQEAQRVDLDAIEPAVPAVTLDAPEQEGTQPGRPDEHHQR